MFLLIMKKSLNISYKKENNVLLDFRRRKNLLKSYFSISIIPMLPSYDILINIDETSFLRMTKSLYSLSKKVEDSELKNIGFNNSTSLITAILLTGKVSAANSSLFVKFSKNLHRFMKKESNVCLK